MNAGHRPWRPLWATAIVVPFALGTLAVPARAAFSSKTIVKCQKAVDSAAQKLFATKMTGALTCAKRLLDCQLREELDGQSFMPCASKALAVCNKKLGKVAIRRSGVTDALSAKCAELTDFNLTNRRGLGYTDVAGACATLAPPATAANATAIGDCLVRFIDCRADDALEQLVPRAYEVFDRSGVLTSFAGDFACLSPRPPSPAITGSSSKDLSSCQQAIEGGLWKRLKVQQKFLHKCADSLLGCQLPVDRTEIGLIEGAECLEKMAGKCDKRFARISKLATVGSNRVATKCAALGAADLLSGLGFSGACATATTVDEVRLCADLGAGAAVDEVVAMSEPRTCRLLEAAGRLSGFDAVCIPSCGNGVVEAAESCDDGNQDDVDSCRNDCTPGSTAFEVVSLPSTATPADTPDGTPATAVPPDSSLAIQFGATEFDLNRALYTRFYVPAAGDPNAVLILVPGFAGGSNSFKFLAENLLARAQATPGLVLEVWAFDRRTNLLEDDAGAVLANQENDPVLAVDWYFGDELGLTLDSRLSRRAVFHAGADVPFLANFTYHVFAADIDAVVEAARALPGSPAVFLGGHSLGTTFAARYAATDFDPGPGVSPGYSKLSGLILFEGGGDSLPTAVPTDDDLDLIIAKADGGLYQAVKNGDARCVDGTPCPGGDGDCAAVPLPVGALTNKCVEPVEAYTGADLSAPFVLVTPQVHASGDVIGIQGRVDPDGLALLQQDFGAGAPVDVVPGLGLLGSLPPSSAKASVGFFLDDDFSPVSAFQASFGYSNNGLNTVIFGLVLPLRAFSPDPYRLWIDIDEPMPSKAIPNNGFATSPTKVNGQEKEVSRASILFSLLRSGEPNFGDWYFASSGLSVTAELAAGGNVFQGGLDSSSLSAGRGRPDIENITQASAIDVPVICFGGTNGLAPTRGAFKAFADSIGACSAASCDGTTPRVTNPLTINTGYGDVAGGFEVHLSEGYAHIDIVSAEDDPAHNNVYAPLMAFLERNTP